MAGEESPRCGGAIQHLVQLEADDEANQGVGVPSGPVEASI